MEKMIKRGLMLTLLLVNTLFVNAQAYEFSCKEREKIPGIYDCMTGSIEIQKDVRIMMAMYSSKGKTCGLDFSIVDNRKVGKQFEIDTKESAVIKLFLSNGDIFTDTKCAKQIMWYYTAPPRYTCNNRSFSNHMDANQYVMSKLRMYNIIKISIDGKVVSTPNYRSAATIDAMCRELIKHTGDQGQYGAKTANNTTSRNNTSSSSRPNPTTRQNSTSTQTRPNTNSNSVNSYISEAKRLFAQKEMDVVRMAKYPLGFLSPSTRTRDEVKKQTDACGVSYDASRETDTLFGSDGYDLKWHGKSPLDVFIDMGGTHWDCWEYTFIYDTNEEGLMRAKEIESTLRSQMGLNWTSPKGNSSKFYYRECEQNGMKYEIDYKEYNSTSYHLNFNIYRLKNNSSTTKSTTTTTNSNNGIKAWFDKIWVDHNVYENGRKGMRIHSHFFVHYAKSLQMSVNYYFYYNDNRVLRDTNKSYCSVDGQVSCSSKLNPGYERTEYSDLSVFMPYDELHLSRGNYHLKFRGEVFYAGKSYGISDWVYFDFNK